MADAPSRMACSAVSIFWLSKNPLRHRVRHVGRAQARHVHPVGAHDQRGTVAPLEERREAHRLAGTHQDPVHAAADHRLGDRAQLHDVGGHVAHITVIGGDTHRAPIAVTVEQSIQTSL